jgi:hypothetical protein
MTTAAARIYLINPGGELGSLHPWTPSGSSSPRLDNGTANNGSTPPHSGHFDFYGDLGGQSLDQSVSLANMFSTAQLDSGSLIASISFWQKSAPASPPDTAQVDLIFLSATNSSLSTVTTGPKACTSAWCHVTANWSLPVGTRTIDYVMKFTNNHGSYADTWIDDNILNVT